MHRKIKRISLIACCLWMVFFITSLVGVFCSGLGFEGSGIVGISTALGSNSMNPDSPYLNVKLFGADPTGVKDSTMAIQAAIDNSGISHYPVYFPPGTYRTSSTLKVKQNYVRLFGLHAPKAGDGADPKDIGTTILYAGQGKGSCALEIGRNPDKDGETILGVIVENLRFKLQENTEIGIRAWMPQDLQLKNLALFGSSGKGNIGIKLEGSVHSRLESIDIWGNGTSLDPKTYLGWGIYVTLGWKYSQYTTTDIDKCYIHYCHTGAAFMGGGFVNAHESIFEASKVGLHLTGTHDITDCWFEANIDMDIYFYQSVNVRIAASHFDSYTRPFLFKGEGAIDVEFDKCYFSSTARKPFLFPSDTKISGSRIRLLNPVFGGPYKGNYLVVGPLENHRLGYDQVKLVGMPISVYRFFQNNVQPNTAYKNLKTEIPGITAYKMREGGNIIGINVYYSLPIRSRGYDIAVKINDSVNNLPGINPPVIGKQTTDLIYRDDYLKNRFAAGGNLTTYLHTDSAFGPSGGTMVFEVIVAHGKDGK